MQLTWVILLYVPQHRYTTSQTYLERAPNGNRWYNQLNNKRWMKASPYYMVPPHYFNGYLEFPLIITIYNMIMIEKLSMKKNPLLSMMRVTKNMKMLMKASRIMTSLKRMVNFSERNRMSGAIPLVHKMHQILTMRLSTYPQLIRMKYT